MARFNMTPSSHEATADSSLAGERRTKSQTVHPREVPSFGLHSVQPGPSGTDSELVSTTRTNADGPQYSEGKSGLSDLTKDTPYRVSLLNQVIQHIMHRHDVLILEGTAGKWAPNHPKGCSSQISTTTNSNHTLNSTNSNHTLNSNPNTLNPDTNDSTHHRMSARPPVRVSDACMRNPRRPGRSAALDPNLCGGGIENSRP